MFDDEEHIKSKIYITTVILYVKYTKTLQCTYYNNLIDDSHYYHSKVEISSRSSPKIYMILLYKVNKNPPPIIN